MIKNLFVAIFFFHCYVFTQQMIQNPQKNQLLWQISGNGLKKHSYLYGSYHSNDPKVFNFSDSLYHAFLKAEAVVLEADIYQLFSDYENETNTTNIKFDSNGKPYTSDRYASKTRYGSEDGRPQFLDLYFQQLGQNLQKKIFALETVEEQLDAFESIFERTVTQKKLENHQIIQDKLFQAYLKGDIETIRIMIENQLNDSPSAYERLIVKRNNKMANGIDSLCKKQSLFVAVGAGHLSGNDGIISLLRKKGYVLKQIIPTFNYSKEHISSLISPYNQFKHIDTKYKFTAVFGSKPLRDTNALSYRLVYYELGQGNGFIIDIEQATNSNLEKYYNQVINPPNNAITTKILHQNKFIAYEGIGFEFGFGLCWKRIFIQDGKLIKLICYGGNKFMNSNRPKSFFEKVNFD